MLLSVITGAPRTGQFGKAVPQTTQIARKLLRQIIRKITGSAKNYFPFNYGSARNISAVPRLTVPDGSVLEVDIPAARASYELSGPASNNAGNMVNERGPEETNSTVVCRATAHSSLKVNR